MLRFPRGFDLGALIAPVGLEAFRAEHWDRAPLRLSRRAPDFYANLLTLDDVDRMVAHAPVGLSFADARAGKGRGWLVEEGGTHPAVDALLARAAGGATLILDGADARLANLGLMCRLLAAQTGFGWHCNLYATPPGGQGFAAHVDDTGVFVLQVFGEKSWTWGGRQERRPVRGEGGGEAPLDWAQGGGGTVLKAGDLLYLPRGWAHAAEAGATGALHVTLTVTEYSWADLSGSAVPQDSPLRDLLPFGFHRDEAGLVDGLAARGIQDAQTRVAAFLDKVAGRFRPDLTGRLGAVLAPSGVTLETRLVARDDVLWRLSFQGEAVHLICGPIRLAFPACGAPAAQAALSWGGLVADLPGDLSDAERLALSASLLAHGLVHRG